MTPSDENLAKILLETRTIAMVGASVKPDRPSNGVGNYMAQNGYRVIPVNPGHTGKTLFGEVIREKLADIDERVDLLNIFRTSGLVEIVKEAMEALPDLKTVWMQQGIADADARALAKTKGLIVIENRCIAVDHRRLLGARRSA